ncbi:MAG: DUF3307 domain-containing protein [Actinomycetota bacterium]|nr:DUF3307 domain-containing protein [Actinomycetota bacterium]
MNWSEVFVVFLVSHLAGDYLLQTEFQALNKRGGLTGAPARRRALVNHVLTYTLIFVPALLWLSGSLGVGGMIGVAALIAIPHLIQDDGRLLTLYGEKVKNTDISKYPMLGAAMDQSLHVIALFLLALLIGT